MRQRDRRDERRARLPRARLPGARAIAIAIAALGTSGILTVPRVARAQDAAAAEVLFEHGRSLLVEGKLAEACPKLEESLRLDPGIGTMLYLGECWQRAGKTASAWLLFRDAETRSAKDNDPRAKIAHDRAEMLAPLLSMIAVRVTNDPPVPGLTVTRDGRIIEPSQWGVETVVDPGDHVVRASAPGYRAWETKVAVGVNAGHFAVTVPSLELGTSALRPSPADKEREEAGAWQRGIGIGVGGLGLIGFGVGTYFGLSAIAKNGRADTRCIDLDCDAEGVRIGDEAQDHATVSTIAFVAGAALVIGGVILVLTAPRSRSGVVSTGVVSTGVGPRSLTFRF